MSERYVPRILQESGMILAKSNAYAGGLTEYVKAEDYESLQTKLSRGLAALETVQANLPQNPAPGSRMEFIGLEVGEAIKELSNE